jgi:hypothetical protein
MCAAALFGVLGVAAPACAEPRISDLAGRWALETAPHHESGCVIRGGAHAAPEAGGAKLRLDMNVTAECPNGGVWHARETCEGALSGGMLYIACTLVSANPPTYVADKFALDKLSATLMAGRLYDDVWWNEPVQWRRLAPALVS